MKTSRDKTGIKGIHRFQQIDMSSMRARRADARIREFLGAMELITPDQRARFRKEWVGMRRDLADFVTRELVLENMIVLEGRSIPPRRLVGDTTYPMIMTHAALGTGVATPTDADTQLGSETALTRTIPAGAVLNGDSADLDWYFPITMPAGTYTEFGTFVDASLTIDSGQMWTRLLTGGWTISGTQAITVASSYPFENA